MDNKTESFVTPVLSKQINTKEEFDALYKDFDTRRSNIKKLTFTGNSYSLHVSTYIAQLLESCPNLTVF